MEIEQRASRREFQCLDGRGVPGIDLDRPGNVVVTHHEVNAEQTEKPRYSVQGRPHGCDPLPRDVRDRPGSDRPLISERRGRHADQLPRHSQ